MPRRTRPARPAPMTGAIQGPDGPVLEHQLHLQGVQRQRLQRPSWPRASDFPDQAGHADQAYRGRRSGQRQADDLLLRDGDSGTLSKWQYKKKEGTGNFDASWTGHHVWSTTTSLSYTITGLTDGTNYQFKVRAVNGTGNGADSAASAAVQPAGPGLAASSDRGHDRDADHLQLHPQLVLQGDMSATGRRPARPAAVTGATKASLTGLSLEHQLHLQGVQRQRLQHRAGRGLRFPDQAGHADQAYRGRRSGQRQADDLLLRDGQWHAEQVAVQEEGGAPATSTQ